MSERIRARDLAFLAAETPNEVRHNATVEIFDAGESGFDYDRLSRLVGERISFVPRYRQRLLAVPGRLADPVWVDDENFDLGYHLRRSALPRPGTDDQLRELVARIISRPLDRSRPLWEMYVVEGLADDRVAVLSKSHQALVDGVHTVDIGQLLLDVTPEPKDLERDDWVPQRTPSAPTLVAGALRDSLTSPGVVLDRTGRIAGSALRVAGGGVKRARKTAKALTGRGGERRSVMFGPLSQQRRVVMVETDLADYRLVRAEHGGTVNDVILTTITGGLRAWMMTRAESMGGIRKVRAVVPVSVIDEELEATSLGSQIAAHVVDLPVGETSPVVRLHQISYSFQLHKDTGRGVAANRLAGIAGFAPTTFHAIGSRVADDELRRGYDVSITNVPGPQTPLFAAGAPMVATYPVPPLYHRHPLSVGVTSYDGKVFYGITADRDVLPDVDVFGTCITEALTELIDLSTGARKRVPRGRKKAAARPARTAGRGTRKPSGS